MEKASVTFEKYGLKKLVASPYEQAVQSAREALKEEGFGVLTEIDVTRAMKEKLGEDFPNYIILGACNPKLAHQALVAEIDIGLLLPCNVVVYETQDGCVVAAMDPVPVLSLVDNPKIEPIATQVREQLMKVLEAVA